MCLKSYRINQDLSKWGKVVYFYMSFMLVLALLSENVSYSWQRPLAGCLKFKVMTWYLQLVKRWSKKAWKLINFTQLHSSCCFFLCFCLLFSYVRSPLFLWLEHRSFCVCFSVFILLSWSLVPSTRSYLSIEIIVSVVWNFFKRHVSDHNSVDYLEEGGVFWSQSPFRVSTLCIIIRLLGWLYHFNILWLS